MECFITIPTDALAELWPQMEPFWTSNSGFILALFLSTGHACLGEWILPLLVLGIARSICPSFLHLTVLFWGGACSVFLSFFFFLFLLQRTSMVTGL